MEVGTLYPSVVTRWSREMRDWLVFAGNGWDDDNFPPNPIYRW